MKSLLFASLHFRRLLFIFCLFSIFTVSCKKEEHREIRDLKFPIYTYYVPEGAKIQLYIQDGNQQYTLKAGDKSLIETTLLATELPAGYIQVKGLKKGSTELTVTDDVTGQEAHLNIHVVDPFLVMKVNDLIPGIFGSKSLNSFNSIRDKLAEAKYNGDFFSNGEIVILRRNPDKQFLVFRNEEDLERGVIYKSGIYKLDLSSGSSNKFVLTFGGSGKTIDFIIHPETTSHTILSDFSKNKLAGPEEFNPQNPYPHVYLTRDFTDEFQLIDSDLERVELSQAMFTYPYFLPMKFAEGILE